jgi:hypothetical protein
MHEVNAVPRTLFPSLGRVYPGLRNGSIIEKRGGVVTTTGAPNGVVSPITTIDYQDVDQGTLNDCWLISAIAALAYHRPDEITRMIRAKDDSWTVSLAGGAPAVVQPDNLGVSPTWARLLELAVAAHGWSIDRGRVLRMGIGIALLTGNRTRLYGNLLGLTRGARRAVREALTNRKLVIAGTGICRTTLPGLQRKHIYAILDHDPAKGLLLLRNPDRSTGTPVQATVERSAGPGEFWITERELNDNFMGIALER